LIDFDRLGIVRIRREIRKKRAQKANPRSILPDHTDFHWRVKITESSNNFSLVLAETYSYCPVKTRNSSKGGIIRHESERAAHFRELTKSYPDLRWIFEAERQA
jgi:hypothetical protein